MSGALIVAAARTPIGTAGHGLAAASAADLGAAVVRAVADRARLVPDEVILGNCMGPGGNLARVAALAAGLPDTVPAVSVDRQCASGLAAIELGIRLAQGGRHVIAGGAESATTAPWRYWPPTPDGEPVRYTRAPFAPEPRDVDMGEAADLLAEEAGIPRSAQDDYAARSHRLAVAAAAGGAYDAELVPVAGLERDERPKPKLAASRLARFPAAFRAGGSVTIGNSCGINDGAAAVGIVPLESHAASGPALRVLGVASAGVAPERPGIGLVPAARAALAEAGLTLADVDVIEFNEAFAGQVLACCAQLDLDPERVCRQGGALALGHPWGASGAVLVVRLFSQLAGRPGGIGLAAIAAGGGQGTALVVQSCR